MEKRRGSYRINNQGISCFLEEKEDKSKQLRTRDLVVEVDRTQEGLENLSIQESREYTP
jgi:hypothetical protein